MACIDFNSDTVFKALNQELNNRYGKGELYKNYDYLNFQGETYTHVTEDRIKRTFEIDRYVLEGKRQGTGGDPIRLISEDHSHRHSMTFPSYPINPYHTLANAQVDILGMDEIEHEKMRGHYIKEKYEDKPKKKSTLIGNIRERLQKETDNWLKSVQKEED